MINDQASVTFDWTIVQHERVRSTTQKDKKQPTSMNARRWKMKAINLKTRSKCSDNLGPTFGQSFSSSLIPSPCSAIGEILHLANGGELLCPHQSWAYQLERRWPHGCVSPCECRQGTFGSPRCPKLEPSGTGRERGQE